MRLSALLSWWTLADAAVLLVWYYIGEWNGYRRGWRRGRAALRREQQIDAGYKNWRPGFADTLLEGSPLRPDPGLHAFRGPSAKRERVVFDQEAEV